MLADQLTVKAVVSSFSASSSGPASSAASPLFWKAVVRLRKDRFNHRPAIVPTVFQYRQSNFPTHFRADGRTACTYGPNEHQILNFSSLVAVHDTIEGTK